MAFLMSGSADVWPATKTRPGTLTAGPEKLVRLQVFKLQKVFLTVVRLGRKFGGRDEFARHFECGEDVFDGWDEMLMQWVLCAAVLYIFVWTGHLWMSLNILDD